MCKFDHPGILRLKAVAISDSGDLYSEVDFFVSGDLKQWMRNNPNRTHPQNGSILFQLSHALRILHENGIIHRDIKPANILMTQDNRPVIADFDSSLFMETGSSMTTEVETLEYLDPALVRSGLVSESSDLYSLGVIASELIIGTRVTSPADVPKRNDVPEDAQELLKGLLCHDVNRRWTLSQLLSCRYVKGILKCVVCLEHFIGDELVHCSLLPYTDAVNHSVCRPCFAGYLGQFLNAPLGTLQKSQGTLTCPVPSCARVYSEAAILLNAHDQFGAYLRKRDELKETKIAQRLNQEAEERLKRELDRLMKMDAEEREAECVKREIVEKILNLSCPRCGQVFVDFSGCCALTCSRCQCGFCAWCLADCGDDAHAHVAGCAHNRMPSRQVYADAEVWRKAHQARKMKSVQSKLTQIKSEAVKKRVLSLLESDLEEMEIKM
eukprot:TRINITY_DN214_c1_g1_i7.p1 TRINITY_DN214_c1_g1~~TRINITY_DN214_c1_g1_i7.p1  ORF type:complete len:439 (-),score=89.62 TRINITY_DN214_c1_g1_i7:86-1402(-)